MSASVEDVVPEFGRIVTEIGWDCMAPYFATDVIGVGLDPSGLRYVAEQWRKDEFDPPEIADRIDALAENVEALVKEGML